MKHVIKKQISDSKKGEEDEADDVKILKKCVVLVFRRGGAFGGHRTGKLFRPTSLLLRRTVTERGGGDRS